MNIDRMLVRMGLLCLTLFFLSTCRSIPPQTWEWELLDAEGTPTARHEAGLVAYNNKLILLGGRRINPTSIFDIESNSWSEHAKPPVEIHHFQPVRVKDAIYILGALTGGWPSEKPLDRVLIYYPDKDIYEFSHPIPKHRQRGGAGAAEYNGKIYLVGGITNGHMDGYRNWFDEYDPETGEWTVLPDAPTSRDHFQVAVAGNSLYAFGGRRSSRRTNEDMDLTVKHGNVFDFNSAQWDLVTDDLALPTMRAGNSVFSWHNEIIVGGGESTAHVVAHNEMQAYNSTSKSWRNWPSLNRGRHGTGLVVVDDYVYTASGCGNRGGEPELTSIERLRLPSDSGETLHIPTDRTPVYAQWHTITLSFEGPETSETAENNPFLNYRLDVELTHAESQYKIRGFYAADGQAAESSADSGPIWSARFTPDKPGEWTYAAVLSKGKDIALWRDDSTSEKIAITNATGKFIVTQTDKDESDFRANGRVEAADGYFRFRGTTKQWLKAGANSPENFLAFTDFDATYRIPAIGKDGEAAPPETIHEFAPHLGDWKTGDPSWQNGKGKGIIGAVNYLASKGMNAVYFLTMNLLGDGKDVWPYAHPDDFTRFDVSKLEQWEIVFSHMQSQGILLHVVLQETENETMLDEGDTGRLRQLYFNELIARFGHHLGLVWNLGEENGPAPWTSVGQNDAQRKAMASYLKANDPYNHPVLLHTHSYDPLREEVLTQILGFQDLDGLSLQVNLREGASEVLGHWRDHARQAGHEWLITMDEIGEWHTAVLPDDMDPDHPTIRRYALWGTLMSGAAGVEWYFGAKYPHNDLSSEDWRQRDRLWDLTHYAHDFFETYLRYWEMRPAHNLMNEEGAYCLRKKGALYAVYLPDSKEYTLDLTETTEEFYVQWYDPLQGGSLKKGTVTTLKGGGVRKLGVAQVGSKKSNQDWVLLIEKIEK